jgi:hypothetical protein
VAKFVLWLKRACSLGLRLLPPNHNTNSVLVRLGQGDFTRNYGPDMESVND